MELQRLKPTYCGAFAAGLKPGPPKKCPSGKILSKKNGVFGRAVVLVLLVLALSASASARQLKIEKFSAEIFVQPDSTLDVTETIEVNFIGVWHGLYRTIPVEYVTPQGFNYYAFREAR